MFPLTVFFITLLTFGIWAKSDVYILRVAHQKRGILTLSFDPSEPRDRAIQLLATTQAGYQPGWLYHREDYLYSVSRTQFPDNSSTSGGIFAFRKLPNGHLEPSDAVASQGEGGVYLDISRDGKMLSTANIDGSTVSIFPLTSAGHFGRVSHVFHYNLTQPGPGTGDSQEIANPHAAVFSPSGDILAVPDRGADCVYIYQVHDAKNVKQIRTLTLLPGTGPRHILFSKVSQEKTLMFLVSELDNTINVFSLEHGAIGCHGKHLDLNDTLRITPLQRASTLNDSSKRTKPTNVDLASELAISNDRRMLYASNRNTESVEMADTIAIYSLDIYSNKPLRFLGLNSTYGKIPRHFSLSSDPHNEFLAVVNQVTNDLFILKRDSKTGLTDRILGNFSLGKLDLTTKVGPMAVVWD
ncbi:hypothetical protein FGADI_748 [Fusarium gaditjirri]|uniref:6-phosphogluconolactonase n=1 Tax=Fusarium gaditjirri TaxID=282569 RepID=A0A8H4TMH8_9HYPO|nr:hypothetical protein FGADI_748 [Fusarium gaditjirri]